MKSYANLYQQLCSYENLLLAFNKARRGKTEKDYVVEFESDLDQNLNQLKHELETFAYSPSPMTSFIVRDPKTRRINASSFRDRVVHHALCNVIGPIFEKSFIHDSYANRRGKGVHAAIRRFERFLRQVTCNGSIPGNTSGGVACYVLKADITHYFETVDHRILLGMIGRKIRDRKTIWLTDTIIKNYKTQFSGKGMPLGNLTSQFFANVYLNELDYFAKQKLNARYYLRYVDDFVILHRDKRTLEDWKNQINSFLRERLAIELHPDKSRVILLKRGTTLLGFRIFYHHRLLKESNAKRIWKRLDRFKQRFDSGEMSKEDAERSLAGWLAYSNFANTYGLRKRVTDRFADIFG